MTVLTWSDDRVEQLKKLWESGLSASQIAAELGNVTRNAVIGKVHRLGLSGRAKAPATAARHHQMGMGKLAGVDVAALQKAVDAGQAGGSAAPPKGEAG